MDTASEVGAHAGTMYHAMNMLHAFAKTHPELEKFAAGFDVLRGGPPDAPMGRYERSKASRWGILAFRPKDHVHEALTGRKSLAKPKAANLPPKTPTPRW